MNPIIKIEHELQGFETSRITQHLILENFFTNRAHRNGIEIEA
jgi:hypothetical protein